MAATFNYPSVQWWVRAVLDIDRDHPGLAGQMMRASDHRRQASAAVLAAHIDCDDGPQGLKVQWTRKMEISELLLAGRLETLIIAAYGSCPPPFLSMLSRMDDYILSPHIYRRLYDIYSNDDHAAVAAALRAVKHPVDAVLDNAIGCPTWLLKTGVLPTLRSAAHRDDLVKAIELIKEVCPAADDEAIKSALRAAAMANDTSRFIERWLRKAEFPKVQLDLNSAFTQVENAAELARWARKFKNCSQTYRLEVVSGVSAFFICRAQSQEYMTHLRRADVNCAWEYGHTYSPSNGPVPASVREFAETCMRNAGVIMPRGHLQVPERWRPIQRLVDPFDTDIEPLDFDI